MFTFFCRVVHPQNINIQEHSINIETAAYKRSMTKTHTYIIVCDMTYKAHNNVLMPIIYSVSVGSHLQRPLLALIRFYTIKSTKFNKTIHFEPVNTIIYYLTSSENINMSKTCLSKLHILLYNSLQLVGTFQCKFHKHQGNMSKPKVKLLKTGNYPSRTHLFCVHTVSGLHVGMWSLLPLHDLGNIRISYTIYKVL